jgi:hypothetical protein
MATVTRAAQPAPRATDQAPIDTTDWPPMADDLKAAHLRMVRDPHIFDEYGDDDWVVFSGAEIIAAGPEYDEVIRVADATGKPITVIVPMMGNWM